MNSTAKTGLPTYQDYLKHKHSLRNTPAEVIDALVLKATGSLPRQRTRLIEGENSEVYDVVVGLGKHFIVRISHDFFRYQAESWALQKCWGLGLPVPSFVFVQNLKVKGKKISVCIQEKLEGRSLEVQKVEIKQKPQDFQSITFQAGQILSKIHSIRTLKYGVLNSQGKGEYQSWLDYLLEPTDNLAQLKRVLEAEGMDPSLPSKYLKLLQKHTQVLLNNRQTLLHGDFSLKHILVKNDQISGVIDFEWCKSGDPADDLAYWDYYTGGYLPTDWLIEGYQDKQVLSNNFEVRFHILRMRLGLYQMRDEFWGNVNWAKQNLKQDIKYFNFSKL